MRATLASSLTARDFWFRPPDWRNFGGSVGRSVLGVVFSLRFSCAHRSDPHHSCLFVKSGEAQHIELILRHASVLGTVDLDP